MPLVLSGTQGISSNGTNFSFIPNDSGFPLTPLRPSFFAHFPGSPTPTVASAATITFTATEHNIGGHYNTSNGRFTAPVAGRYYFQWGGLGNNGASVYRFYLYKNSTVAVPAQTSAVQVRCDGGASGSEYPNGARSAILNLNANDFIQVFYSADDSTSVAAWDYLSFMGFLIG